MAEAFEWYEARSPGLGDDFLTAVEEGLISARKTPQRFPVVHREGDLEVRRARLRRFPFGLFFIWDDTETGDTSVIACLHARRDPRRWRRRS